MTEMKTHAGGCHCGAVRYEATSDLTQVVSCNCSICNKRGALWTFLPASRFRLLKGEDAVSDYQFGKKTIHHLFCTTCGVGSFSRGQAPDGQETFAVNVRCLDDVDGSALKPMPFDGKAL
jgi:hypothetical protein